MPLAPQPVLSMRPYWVDVCYGGLRTLQATLDRHFPSLMSNKTFGGVASGGALFGRWVWVWASSRLFLAQPYHLVTPDLFNIKSKDTAVSNHDDCVEGGSPFKSFCK